MTPTKRTFPLGAVLSLTTGRALCEFSAIHELAEWVLGHPVWTHEFAEKAVWDGMRAAVFAQHPALETVIADGVTRENWRECLDGWETHFGKFLEIISGTQERTESPLDSLQRIAPDKPVIAVTTPPSPESNQEPPHAAR